MNFIKRSACSVVVIMLTFFICFNTVALAVHDNEMFQCYVCGKYHEWQYLYDLNEFDTSKSPCFLCEDCRKKIILDGKTYGLEKPAKKNESISDFLDYLLSFTVIEDGIIKLLIPPDYYVYESEGQYHEFIYEDDSGDIYDIVVGWSDYLSSNEDRSAFCFKSNFSHEELSDYQDVIDYFSLVEDSSYESGVLEKEDALYFTYQYEDGLVIFVTVEYGIQYTIICNLQLEDESPKAEFGDRSNIFAYLKLLEFVNNICYPSLQEILEYDF